MAKILTGQVVSNKMVKTVVVKVVQKFSHPKYKKTVFKSKKYKADTNGFQLEEGDSVVIQETRPISKNKHFKVIQKIERA
ncbi:MAG: hypothetical protein KatS3mg090_0286 [Patescibacteria group bacterium]|nr:MAG: hypothetical protein KatS3mg090_0286 [Patescibacteria group bacterium]